MNKSTNHLAFCSKTLIALVFAGSTVYCSSSVQAQTAEEKRLVGKWESSQGSVLGFWISNKKLQGTMYDSGDGILTERPYKDFEKWTKYKISRIKVLGDSLKFYIDEKDKQGRTQSYKLHSSKELKNHEGKTVQGYEGTLKYRGNNEKMSANQFVTFTRLK